jgi:hypothetical protein
MMKSLQHWFIQTFKHYAWAPGSIFLFHVIASKGFDAYYHFPGLDIPMHFFGGVAIAYFCYGSFINAKRFELLGNPNKFVEIITIFSLASTSTIFWEFAEYISDHLFGTHMQGGLEDTLLDMLLGMCGGLLLISIIHIKNLIYFFRSTK